MTISSLRQEIERLKELEKRATPGSWTHAKIENAKGEEEFYLHAFDADFGRKIPIGEFTVGQDRVLVSALRNSAPRLLEILEKALECAEIAKKFRWRCDHPDGAEVVECKDCELKLKLQALDKIVGEGK